MNYIKYVIAFVPMLFIASSVQAGTIESLAGKISEVRLSPSQYMSDTAPAPVVRQAPSNKYNDVVMRENPVLKDPSYGLEITRDDNIAKKKFALKNEARAKAAKLAKLEAEKKAKLEAEMKAKEKAKLEAEKKAKEMAKLEAEKKAKEMAKLEAEKKAKEMAKLEAEKKAKELAKKGK